MKAVVIQPSGSVERVDLPEDRHQRNEEIKKLSRSPRQLSHTLTLKKESLVLFFGSDPDENKVASKLARKSATRAWHPDTVTGPVVVTGKDAEGWETDISERMATKIVAMAPVITL